MTEERATPIPGRAPRLRGPGGRPQLPPHPGLDDYAQAFCEMAWDWQDRYETKIVPRWLVTIVVGNSLAITALAVWEMCRTAGVCR